MRDREENQRPPFDSDSEEREICHLLERAGPRPEIPAGDFRILKAAARSEWNKLVESRRRSWIGRPLVSTAAAAALVGAIALSLWLMTKSDPAPPGTVASVELIRGDVWLEEPEDLDLPDRSTLTVGGELLAGIELVTASASETSVNTLAFRLADRQSVRLRSGSRVRLHSRDRLELLAGTLYVDSDGSPQAGGGVEIITPLGTVFDIGTRFEVSLDDTEDALRVRVRGGSISLVHDQESVSATAGEELRLSADGSLDRGPWEANGDWDWILDAAPPIDIEGLSLLTFLDWVADETGWRIEYQDDVLASAVAGIELHGTIEGLRPDEAILVVLPGSGLGHRLFGDVLLVERLPPNSKGL